jgi:hypothetical protein
MERSISRGLGSAGASRAFSAADSWASLVCACLGMISVPRPCDRYHGEPEVKSGSLPSIPISNGEPDLAHLRQVPRASPMTGPTNEVPSEARGLRLGTNLGALLLGVIAAGNRSTAAMTLFA